MVTDREPKAYVRPFPGMSLLILAAVSAAAWVLLDGPVPAPFRAALGAVKTLPAALDKAGMVPQLPSWTPLALLSVLAVLVLLCCVSLLRWVLEALGPREVLPGIVRTAPRKYETRGDAVLSTRLVGDLRVPPGSRLLVSGMLVGDLTVEPGGGAAVTGAVEGTVSGTVTLNRPSGTASPR